jgi:hypothetical protein
MFTQKVANRICQRLADGESLRKACSEGPDPSTVLRWVDQFPEFAQQYTRARQAGYLLLADQIIDISDEVEVQPVTSPDGEVVEVRLDATAVARNRLRVDSRKWMLAKMLPKIYGDKVDHQHSGVNGGPIEHGVTLNVIGVPSVK